MAVTAHRVLLVTLRDTEKYRRNESDRDGGSGVLIPQVLVQIPYILIFFLENLVESIKSHESLKVRVKCLEVQVQAPAQVTPLNPGTHPYHGLSGVPPTNANMRKKLFGADAKITFSNHI